MSASSQVGGQRVGRVITMLSGHGYRCARLSASGQRRGARRDERGLDGDVIALAPPDSRLPHLILEVGGAGKRVQQSLAELCEHPLPGGFVAVVARLDVFAGSKRKRWRWYSYDADGFDLFDDVLRDAGA